MDYAVIKIQGHEEIVTAGTRNLIVDRVVEKEGTVLKPPVLLTSIEGSVQVGTPTVDFPLELEIVKHQRGDKNLRGKIPFQSAYRKRIGFPRGAERVESGEIWNSRVKKATKTAVKSAPKTVKIAKKKQS